MPSTLAGARRLATIDPAARRRLDVGLACLDAGDPVAACAAIAAALALAPDDAEAWYALGQAREHGGPGDAADAYARAIAADPADRMGAAIRRALLGAGPTPDHLPLAHLQALYQEYAPRFDSALIDGLGYCAPALLREAIDAVRPDGPLAVLDLGCGTGLAGAAFADRGGRLDGIDLSPAMLEAAGRRGLYRRLVAGDLVGVLSDWSDTCDLLLAADVLIYFGDLAPVFAAAARVARPEALFALTLERAEIGGWHLGARHRYAHSAAYVVRTASCTGWRVLRLDPASTRTENRSPVPGWLVLLQRMP
jgi:predicted TPR repeat methyltransferase